MEADKFFHTLNSISELGREIIDNILMVFLNKHSHFSAFQHKNLVPINVSPVQ